MFTFPKVAEYDPENDTIRVYASLFTTENILRYGDPTKGLKKVLGHELGHFLIDKTSEKLGIRGLKITEGEEYIVTFGKQLIREGIAEYLVNEMSPKQEELETFTWEGDVETRNLRRASRPEY